MCVETFQKVWTETNSIPFIDQNTFLCWKTDWKVLFARHKLASEEKMICCCERNAVAVVVVVVAAATSHSPAALHKSKDQLQFNLHHL